jgi:CheY-like chemotaxis protein
VSLQPGQAASKRAVAPAVAAAAVVTEPDAMWQPRRVLYVEDNPVNAILMQAVFEDCEGYVLDVVDSGRQALALVQHTRPDALLLDMHLPDTDGPTLLRALRSEPGLDGVPAIAVSADAMPDDIDRALAAGFADYWTKPLDIALVLPTLHALLASSGPGGGTIQG